MSSSLTRPRPAASSPRPKRAPSGRDPWFDNAKMILVTLVVVGHSWVLLPADSLARNWLYDFMYLWHMPAFLVVTGYLSRSFTWSRRNLWRLVTLVAVPYVVFEALMATFRVRVGGETGIDTLFVEPHWPMWFLAALFFWRLATPLLKVLPYVLALAVGVSLLGGLLPGNVLDVGRIAGMLPFFVLGLVARPEHVDRLRTPAFRRAAVALLSVAFVAAVFVDGLMRTEWLYWRSDYDALEVSFATGAAVRLGLLVVSTMLALSALSLVPDRRHWFTGLGAATMTVYLFHGFFIRGTEYAGLLEWSDDRPWLGLLTATAASVVLAVLLAAPPVSRRLEVVIDPVGALQRGNDQWPAPYTLPVGPEAPPARRRPLSHLPL